MTEILDAKATQFALDVLEKLADLYVTDDEGGVTRVSLVEFQYFDPAKREVFLERLNTHLRLSEFGLGDLHLARGLDDDE